MARSAFHGFSGSETATTVTDTSVTYHATLVAERLPNGKIRLNSGGWKTRMTIRRMNQAGFHWGRGSLAYQKAGNWYVTDGRAFYDGIEV